VWAIDELLELLKDGAWHHLSEITSKTPLQERQAKLILDFLSTHQFIKVDRKSQQVKLCRLTLEFLKEPQPIDEEEDMAALRLR
jgi:hypothetical protein